MTAFNYDSVRLLSNSVHLSCWSVRASAIFIRPRSGYPTPENGVHAQFLIFSTITHCVAEISIFPPLFLKISCFASECVLVVLDFGISEPIPLRNKHLCVLMNWGVFKLRSRREHWTGKNDKSKHLRNEWSDENFSAEGAFLSSDCQTRRENLCLHALQNEMELSVGHCRYG